MRKVGIVLCCLVMMVFASYASAGQIYSQWTGAISTDWTVAGNWNNGVPQQLDPPNGPQGASFGKAGFKNNSTSPDLSGKTVAVDQLIVGGLITGSPTGGFLTVAGGTINIVEFGIIGNIATESGILNINSGGVVNAGTLWAAQGRFLVGKAGPGVLNMNGGTLNLSSYLGIAPDAVSTANGLVNLYSGIIYASDLQMAAGALGTARMVITNGSLVITGNKVSAITGATGYATKNWITTTNVGGVIMADYNAGTNKTTVYATPEPATVCLLGLGVLGLLRRNRK
jgi:hypothetical protein